MTRGICEQNTKIFGKKLSSNLEFDRHEFQIDMQLKNTFITQPIISMQRYECVRFDNYFIN